MNGFYLRKKKALKKLIKATFVFLLDTLFVVQKKAAPLPDSPKRILVCNIASFGDVVISTVVLPVLKRNYPECEIGFLTSLQRQDVLKAHPSVSYIHVIDHWFEGRKKGVCKAVFRYLIDWRRVVKEIRELKYDIAIDLYPDFFLTVIPILWRAKIPIRIGWDLPGFSKLLTHVAVPLNRSQYIGQTHLNLLKMLRINVEKESPFPNYFSREIISGLVPKSYIVIHMGTAYSLKEWDTRKWIQVVEQLIQQGENVVLTGLGEREKLRCDQVSSETGCTNYCNQFSWAGFASVIQHAKLLISVDSVAVHLAASVQIPCVVLFAGISSIPLWRPPYSLCRPLMQWPPCAPCLAHEGCSQMSCIQEVKVSEVLQSAYALIRLAKLNSLNFFSS